MISTTNSINRPTDLSMTAESRETLRHKGVEIWSVSCSYSEGWGLRVSISQGGWSGVRCMSTVGSTNHGEGAKIGSSIGWGAHTPSYGCINNSYRQRASSVCFGGNSSLRWSEDPLVTALVCSPHQVLTFTRLPSPLEPVNCEFRTRLLSDTVANPSANYYKNELSVRLSVWLWLITQKLPKSISMKFAHKCPIYLGVTFDIVCHFEAWRPS